MQKVFKNFFSVKKQRLFFIRGFTIAEMLAVFAIIGLILSVVFFNQSKFQSDLEITNVAYRIALEVRQAQVFGISVRQFGTGADSFRSAYGVHFNSPDSNVPNSAPTSLIFFADANDDGKYTTTEEDNICDEDDECIEQVNLGRGNKITGFCGLDADAVDCHSPDDFYALDIIFKRPIPDAVMKVYSDDYSNEITENVCNNEKCEGYAICLESPYGRKKRVVALSTGQISVENVASGEVCGD